MKDLDKLEAERRVEQACRLIESAYRLHSLNPRETLFSVRVAIGSGSEQQAGDIDEQARKALA